MDGWATSTLTQDEMFTGVGSMWRMFETDRISGLSVRAFAKVAGVSCPLKGWGYEEASLVGAGDSPLLAGMLAETTVDKESLMTMVAVVFAGPVHWNGKKDRNRTEPNCKRPDHQLRLHKFWIFSVASCNLCRKSEKAKKTSLSSHHVLDPTYTHFSLIAGLWIIKSDQELVEI